MTNDGAPGLEHEDPGRWGFRVHSQNFEDGVLLYLFSVIGTTDCRFVEFGIGDGRECNTANLSINFGWGGLLMDVDPGHVAAARRYYADVLGESAERVSIAERHVTRDSIDALLREEGVEGDIDLLSIDIDGNDYWVWEAIEAISPRVVVIEYNASFGIDKSISVPYDPDFDRFAKHPSGFYHGASLPALWRLGKRKGYMLVACEAAGVDAFFVRRDAAGRRLLERSPEKVYRPLPERAWAGPPWAQFEMVSHLDVVDVG